MNITAEITKQKNVIADALKEKRRLCRERKLIAADIKGWNDSMEKASSLVELLEAGDVDGYQQTIASAINEKNAEHA